MFTFISVTQEGQIKFVDDIIAAIQSILKTFYRYWRNQKHTSASSKMERIWNTFDQEDDTLFFVSFTLINIQIFLKIIRVFYYNLLLKLHQVSFHYASLMTINYTHSCCYSLLCIWQILTPWKFLNNFFCFFEVPFSKSQGK